MELEFWSSKDIYDMSSNRDGMSSDFATSGVEQALLARQEGCLTTAAPTWFAESCLDQRSLGNEVVDIDRPKFETRVKDDGEKSDPSDIPAPQSRASDPPAESLFLAIPPELRLNIYSFLLLSFSDSINTTVLKSIYHGAIRYYGLVPESETSKARQRLLQHSGVHGMLETHPLIRNEILPMYLNTLPTIWKEYTTLAVSNADRYLEFLAWGHYEPGSRQVLELLDELGKSLASFVLSELCSVGFQHLKREQKACCKELTKTWKDRRTLVKRVDAPGWRRPITQLSMHENQKRPVEAMIENTRFVGSIVQVLDFRL
ncbi:hypothetical protein DOTSEDRAFT_26396 [Dothistroma septosporum NZE10]|uniref:Uncharacterized protein n=1 Tax=Dothistroma septosporum (strain NZE10 / CBS 128990) TaxID=675120 RepID=N1PF11_DOTSN|nr:hypothetical protein DOTSEDRAFT_26396 [Dothistroma septosporum NZE10]